MYIFPFTRTRYIKTITINTHIDCANNSKCSVGDILLATKQGAFESVFGTFSVTELDNTKLCNEEQITKYMCMIGQLQWAITLGRYDILAHVMSMFRFRLAPEIGHLERMKRLYGYHAKTKYFAIRYRTKEHDYSHLPKQE